MKRLILVVNACFLFLVAGAQLNPKVDYSLTWYKGSVIFHTGDSLSCTLRYNQTLSIGAVQILQDDNVITLSSKDVKSFSFYDEEKGRLRKFSSLIVSDEVPENQKVFLEHLYNDSQFSILNQRTVDVPYDYMNYSRFISKPVRMSKKYILDTRTGAVLPLSKENTLKLLEPRKEEIISFIHERHLKFKRVADYIDVFEYHSSL